jgi:hypothetical protein
MHTSKHYSKQGSRGFDNMRQFKHKEKRFGASAETSCSLSLLALRFLYCTPDHVNQP